MNGGHVKDDLGLFAGHMLAEYGLARFQALVHHTAGERQNIRNGASHMPARVYFQKFFRTPVDMGDDTVRVSDDHAVGTRLEYIFEIDFRFHGSTIVLIV